MEGLLAEINKRKAEDFLDGSSSSPSGSGGPSSNKKYLRRADLERMKEEEKARQREQELEEQRKRKAEDDATRAQARASKLRKEAESARNASMARLAGTPDPASDTGSPAPEGSAVAKETFNISPEECVRRLRAKGQPVRLFGETDKDRRLRLRALELLEERGGGGGAHGLNDFRRVVEDMNSREQERQARGQHAKATTTSGAGKGEGGDAGGGDDGEDKGDEDKAKRRGADLGVLDLNLIKTDFNKLHPLIYWAFKNLLKEWDEFLLSRPDDIKRTSTGKLAAANQAQSVQNLKPLFKMLRNRDLPEDVVRHLAEIVHYMQIRSYQKANDAYLRLSIGNAAWPIGVTSVGIHERSAREKIGQDNIAHVLNDEVSRKYIQAVKRLLTFAQTVRPPDNISQLMG